MKPDRRSTALAAFVLVLGSYLFRLPPLLNARSTNSDAAIVGLQAMHILRGERSAFLWGSGYQTSADAWVAERAGSRSAVRAAGTALAHNPVPFIVPCHRVVYSDLSLGKYSAAGGATTKARVLRFEGANTDELAAFHQRGMRFVGHPAVGAFCFPGCGGDWSVGPDDPTFRSAAEARAAGLEPCGDCQPA